HCLADAHDVWNNTVLLAGEQRSGAPETRAYLIEDQQNAERVADVAQAFEIACGRHYASAPPLYGLDDKGGDVAAFGKFEFDGLERSRIVQKKRLLRDELRKWRPEFLDAGHLER